MSLAMTILTGKVVRGDGRGRNLGFATANLKLDLSEDRPKDGIYAAWTTILPSQTRQMSAVHVGPVPTFDKAIKTIEVHILDFEDRDLYGEKLEVQIVERLADVKKMPSIEELKARISRLCAEARQLLQNA
jgi:riboflavin kinase / FMN adenylyltransferase